MTSSFSLYTTTRTTWSWSQRYMRLNASTQNVPRLWKSTSGTTTIVTSMPTRAKTTNMNRVLYHEWLPQIMYNQHQSGPPGTVMFVPPFRDPFNYNFNPLTLPLIDLAALGRCIAALSSRANRGQ